MTLQPFFPYALLTLTIWIAYVYVVFKGNWVSDDFAGIEAYDGKLQGGEYGMISRWLRYHITGGDFPSKHTRRLPDGKKGPNIPQGKIPARHHILVITVFNVATLLTFHFLSHVIGVKLALLACLLFVCHPVGVQAVAWCSGLGYPLSLLWIGAILNLALFQQGHSSPGWMMALTLLFCVFQFLGVHAQVIPMMTWAILLLLGFWQWAILGFLISAVMLFDIVKQTVDFRTTEFKKQNMGGSTSINPRKIIVALKTLFYYIRLVIWPNKMGLYHKWGFHYTKELEREDRMFFAGLLCFIGLVVWFFLTPAFAVKLGILWFLSFIFIFLNWVTIQQFVTERYLFIPSLGFCIIIAYYTQNILPIYTLILGLFLCRLWLHLPTYDNEQRFYLSNTWNFPDSEVAYGNLGVTYLREGMNGSGMDAWFRATQINPDYDVPWYNIFSTFRTNAMMALHNGNYDECFAQLRNGLPYLEKTLACSTCHFPDVWKKEQQEMFNSINNPGVFLQQELNRIEVLKINLNSMYSQATDEKRRSEIQSSISDAQVQSNRLIEYIKLKGFPIVAPNPLSNLTPRR